PVALPSLSRAAARAEARRGGARDRARRSEPVLHGPAGRAVRVSERGGLVGERAPGLGPGARGARARHGGDPERIPARRPGLPRQSPDGGGQPPARGEDVASRRGWALAGRQPALVPARGHSRCARLARRAAGRGRRPPRAERASAEAALAPGPRGGLPRRHQPLVTPLGALADPGPPLARAAG